MGILDFIKDWRKQSERIAYYEALKSKKKKVSEERLHIMMFLQNGAFDTALRMEEQGELNET